MHPIHPPDGNVWQVFARHEHAYPRPTSNPPAICNKVRPLTPAAVQLAAVRLGIGMTAMTAMLPRLGSLPTAGAFWPPRPHLWPSSLHDPAAKPTTIGSRMPRRTCRLEVGLRLRWRCRCSLAKRGRLR
ncbi:MAG: hypothetical protein NTY25_03465 [Planctomycetia bacterium]|nr:hypothetical protein [Planctomycetia bacterium]